MSSWCSGGGVHGPPPEPASSGSEHPSQRYACTAAWTGPACTPPRHLLLLSLHSSPALSLLATFPDVRFQVCVPTRPPRHAHAAATLPRTMPRHAHGMHTACTHAAATLPRTMPRHAHGMHTACTHAAATLPRTMPRQGPPRAAGPPLTLAPTGALSSRFARTNLLSAPGMGFR